MAAKYKSKESRKFKKADGGYHRKDKYRVTLI